MSQFAHQQNRNNSYKKHIIEWKHPLLKTHVKYYNLLGYLRSVVFKEN